jgi:hypothetical protein
MTDIEKSNSLTDLAARIKTEHAATRDAAKKTVAHAIAAVELLIEAKALIGKHGKWLPWLRDNCDLSERMAQNYMRLARNQEALKSETISDLTISDLTIRGAISTLTTSGMIPAVDFDDDEDEEDETPAAPEPPDITDRRDEIYGENEWRRERVRVSGSVLCPQWDLDKFLTHMASMMPGFWNENLKTADRVNFMKKCKGGPLNLMLAEISARETMHLCCVDPNSAAWAMRKVARKEWVRAYDALVNSVELTEDEVGACRKTLTPKPESKLEIASSLEEAREWVNRIILFNEIIDFLYAIAVKQFENREPSRYERRAAFWVSRQSISATRRPNLSWIKSEGRQPRGRQRDEPQQAQAFGTAGDGNDRASCPKVPGIRG